MLNVVTYIVRKTRSLARIYGGAATMNPGTKTNRETCEMLQAYYDANDLYANVQMALREAGQWSAAIKSIRNPVSAIVEFYASTVWPGPLPEALPIVTDNDGTRAAIEEIWRRSNWDARKQLAVRQAAITGDLFLRIATRGGAEPASVFATAGKAKPFIQTVLTKDVSDWREDDAGNIVWLRYEVKRDAEPGDADTRNYYHTEIWTPESCAVYRHHMGFNVAENHLGAATAIEHGLGFVPWVRAAFRDAGERYGYPPFWTALDKIDEVNIKATRLAQLMFRWNKATIAVSANAVDAAGRPMPPPKIGQSGTPKSSADRITFGDDEIILLPGNSSIEHLIPGINWDAHAATIIADLNEIKQDLPELRFYELAESSAISGVAMAYQMAPAVARVMEVRGNLERALVKANMMAITVGQKNGLYLDAGKYEEGATDHRFKTRDVLPVASRDRADTAKVYVDMGVPAAVALQRIDGWTDADLDQLKSAQLDARVASAGVTAGPQADVTAQSASRVVARDAATPGVEAAVTAAITSTIERALNEQTAIFAEFLGAQGR